MNYLLPRADLFKNINKTSSFLELTENRCTYLSFIRCLCLHLSFHIGRFPKFISWHKLTRSINCYSKTQFAYLVSKLHTVNSQNQTPKTGVTLLLLAIPLANCTNWGVSGTQVLLCCCQRPAWSERGLPSLHLIAARSTGGVTSRF